MRGSCFIHTIKVPLNQMADSAHTSVYYMHHVPFRKKICQKLRQWLTWRERNVCNSFGLRHIIMSPKHPPFQPVSCTKYAYCYHFTNFLVLPVSGTVSVSYWTPVLKARDELATYDSLSTASLLFVALGVTDAVKQRFCPSCNVLVTPSTCRLQTLSARKLKAKRTLSHAKNAAIEWLISPTSKGKHYVVRPERYIRATFFYCIRLYVCVRT